MRTVTSPSSPTSSDTMSPRIEVVATTVSPLASAGSASTASVSSEAVSSEALSSEAVSDAAGLTSSPADPHAVAASERAAKATRERRRSIRGPRDGDGGASGGR